MQRRPKIEGARQSESRTDSDGLMETQGQEDLEMRQGQEDLEMRQEGQIEQDRQKEAENSNVDSEDTEYRRRS